MSNQPKSDIDRLIEALNSIRDSINAQTAAVEEQTCAMWELATDDDESEEEDETVGAN